MLWWLLFGGIVLFGAILYAMLGLSLWRKTLALFDEVERAAQKLPPMDLDDAEPPEHRAPVSGQQN